jgi:hypothetical protein
MEMQRADPKLRRTVAWGAVAAAFAGVLGFLLLRQWLAELAHVPAAVAKSQLVNFVAWCLVSLCLSLFAFAGYVLRLGAQVVAHGRLPLPGARVVRDTRVVQGEVARRYGRWLQLLGVALFVASAVGAVLSWRAYGALAAGAT